MKSLLSSLFVSRDISQKDTDPLENPVHQNVNTSRKDGFVFAFDREGEAAHRYRSIRAEILSKQWNRKTILVTSPGAGEGKTLTAVNLAFAFEEKKLSVLLLELTLTRPRFRYVFGAPPSTKGIEAVLRGEAYPEQVICQLGDTGVEAAAVQKASSNHQLLDKNDNLKKLLEYGDKHYDWTILDAPAVSDCDSMKYLAGQAGLSLMVTRAYRTQIQAFKDATQQLQDDLSFVLFNDARVI